MMSGMTSVARNKQLVLNCSFELQSDMVELLLCWKSVWEASHAGGASSVVCSSKEAVVKWCSRLSSALEVHQCSDQLVA